MRRLGRILAHPESEHRHANRGLNPRDPRNTNTHATKASAPHPPDENCADPERQNRGDIETCKCFAHEIPGFTATGHSQPGHRC